MPMDKSRYPENWNAIALGIKESAGWKCQRCDQQCLKPTDSTSELSRSQVAKRTLTVHHSDYCPENNAVSNLIALCSGCHLTKHSYRRGNVSLGQLTLF
jgi:5-methylcytosine-specific restriction endonuclease McrA